jgi:arylsulfatase A-like enzyme
VCLLDFMATAADILGYKIPDNAAEDSVSFLPALKGKNEPIREAIVHHSINGSFSIRQANWKLELCPDSGGWSDPRPGAGKPKGKGKKGKAVEAAPTAKLPPIQLYDLSKDIAEQTNVQAEHPDIVERLSKLLEKYVADGRSTPGAPQKNTVDPNIWKFSRK